MNEGVQTSGKNDIRYSLGNLNRRIASRGYPRRPGKIAISSAVLLSIVILALMLRNLLIAAYEDSATFDEVTYLYAGYSYIHTQDYRLNPEHPPLIKDLIGYGVSTLNPNFPYEKFYASANSASNAKSFLYEMGNDADAMLFRGRLPVIIITISLGLLVFIWSSELNGLLAGLFSLALFAFDPNIIAHGHLATMDMGAAMAIALNLYCAWKYLQRPSLVNLFSVGITLGLAMLTKFSTLALLPVYLILVAYKTINDSRMHKPQVAGKNVALDVKQIGRFVLPFGAAGLIAIAVIYAVYALNSSQTPLDLQMAYINYWKPGPASIIKWLAASGLNPLAQFLLGLSLMRERATANEVVFFLGKLSKGEYYYFPIVFGIKSTLSVLSLMALALVIGRKLRSKSRLAETALISGAIAVAASAILANLNFGIRYLLPIYPLFYIYAGKLIEPLRQSLSDLISRRNLSIKRMAIGNTAFFALIWQIFSSLGASPYYLSYFNELVGLKRGSEIIADSNIDWRQDLKRLEDMPRLKASIRSPSFTLGKTV